MGLDDADACGNGARVPGVGASSHATWARWIVPDRKGWGLDPFTGDLFGFVGKRRDRAKILVWHRGGFVLIYKRLEKGRFRIPVLVRELAELEIHEQVTLQDYIVEDEIDIEVLIVE